jgi:hypothetical protein
MTLELARIFARFSDEFCSTLPMSADQQRVHRAVLACRTPALGVQMYRCDQCDFEQPRYCSCRNRHCPKCQAAVRAQWVEDRSEDVIDAPYFHLVFTLPHELNPLARRHSALLYGLLFETVWSTLNSLARDRLEGQLGMTAVLHTWGQTLTQHIHLHCLIPGGAFDAQRGRWHRARSRFLFPVKVMRTLFRGRFVSQLRRAEHDLSLAAPALDGLLATLMAKEWTVYAKPVLGHAHLVLDYLGRYTYRIAIGHERLLAIQESQVLFRYRDYRTGGRQKIMALAGVEFMRRFLMHALPRGFMRVRHYGFLANRVRRERLARIRQLLPSRARANPPALQSAGWMPRCPACNMGVLRRGPHITRPTAPDSS